MKRLKGTMKIALQIWLFFTMLMTSSALDDVLQLNETDNCIVKYHETKENLLSDVKRYTKIIETTSKLNKISEEMIQSMKSNAKSHTNWNKTIEIVLQSLTKSLQQNNNNISYPSLLKISENLPNKTKTSLQIIYDIAVDKIEALPYIFYRKEIPNNIEIIKYLIQTGCNLTNPRYKIETVLHVATEKGYFNIVKWLINEKHMNVNDLSPQYGTTLHIAVEFGHFDIAKWIINNTDIDINKINSAGETVLFSAYKHIDIAKYLIEDLKMDYNVRSYFRETFLNLAARTGQLELTKWLVEHLKMDINAQNFHGESILYTSYKYPEVVKYLLLQGADYNLTALYGKNILHSAVYNNQPQTVKVILENSNLDVNMVDNTGYTVLQLATHSIEMVKMLVEIGKADVNIKIKGNNQTALHMASNYDNFDTVKYLVENTNIDVNAQDNGGNTALHVATRHIEIVKYLVKKVDINIKNNGGQNVLDKVKEEYNSTIHRMDGLAIYYVEVYKNVLIFLCNVFDVDCAKIANLNFN